MLPAYHHRPLPIDQLHQECSQTMTQHNAGRQFLHNYGISHLHSITLLI